MSVEENKALVRRFFEEVFIQGRQDAIDEFIAPDYYSSDRNLSGIEEYKQRYGENASTFMADAQLTIEDMLGEGDKVVTRFIIRGTHSVEAFGIAPTGKQWTMRGINIIRIADGKIVEEWLNAGFLDMMRQIGAIPT